MRLYRGRVQHFNNSNSLQNYKKMKVIILIISYSLLPMVIRTEYERETTAKTAVVSAVQTAVVTAIAAAVNESKTIQCS